MRGHRPVRPATQNGASRARLEEGQEPEAPEAPAEIEPPAYLTAFLRAADEAQVAPHYHSNFPLQTFPNTSFRGRLKDFVKPRSR